MSMRGPDPYSYDPTPIPYGYDPSSGVWYDDDGGIDWGGLLSQGIDRAAQTAQIIERGYPPGSVVYAPSYPTIPGTSPAPAPAPYPAPSALPPQGAGIQLSTMTLMLIGGAFLLFSLGKSRR
jgi:hypothetical protein